MTKGHKYLGLPPGVGVEGPTKGGNTITISGNFLFPSDFDVQGTSGILGAASVTGVPQIDTTAVRHHPATTPRMPLPSSPTYSSDLIFLPHCVALPQTFASLDTQINLRYLAVVVASVPIACRSAHGTVNCLAKDTQEAFSTSCRISAFPRSGTNDATTTCASWSPPSPVPSIECQMPAGIGAGRDLVIYWHGVGTVLSGWINYDAPRINHLIPSHVKMTGGETITIAGENFGAQVRRE